jgi:SAM-dependent methyltransferase
LSGDNRWLRAGVSGEDYDRRVAELAATGKPMHGEADLVTSFGPRSVLDAGCGTGRVAIELARRGVEVWGVDLDPSMLDVARRTAPDLEWVEDDLATLDLGRRFDLVVAAGNVMIFLAAGTEAEVVGALARHLHPGGRLVAGFQLGPGRLALDDYDGHARAAGLVLEHRWATWERGAYEAGGDYAVSVHTLR